MLTVSALAKKYQLSRATILYYEQEGLLQPACRTENGYRWYGETEIARMDAITAYRSYGLPLATIKELLACQQSEQSELLREHFQQLEEQINHLKQQQRAIVAVLQTPELLHNKAIDKSRWVAIMRAAGFDDTAMSNWHRQFEAMEPEEHQQFLESLGIDETEIKSIRAL